jgi:hypothetical protein
MEQVSYMLDPTRETPMNDEAKITKLGTAILEPIIKGYKAGGMALALILVGTLMLIAAVIAGPGVSAYISAVVGSIIVGAVLAKIYFVEIQEIKRATKTVKDNEALLNSIQSMAIQLTVLSSHLQALAFKHSDKVRPVIHKIRETVRMVARVPMLGSTKIGRSIAGLADHEKVREIDELSGAIVEYTESAKEVIENIRIALTSLDAAPLIEYAEQLKGLDKTLTKILKRGA